MSVSDADRRNLYDRCLAALGVEGADTLMELLPPVGWNDVARRGDLAEVRGEMALLRGEIAEVRGEVAEIRGEVRAQLPRLITANVASMIGVAGLVLAAVRF